MMPVIIPHLLLGIAVLPMLALMNDAMTRLLFRWPPCLGISDPFRDTPMMIVAMTQGRCHAG